MGDDFVGREEFGRSLERIHTRVDEISKSSTSTEISARYIAESVKAMHEIVFGNGKPGILTRVATVCTRVCMQWWVLGIIIVCCGGLLFLMWNHVARI